MFNKNAGKILDGLREPQWRGTTSTEPKRIISNIKEMKKEKKTIKYLENIKKKAERLSKKRFEYCKVCKKKLAEWVLSPDGDGGMQSSLKDVKDNKYSIYQAENGGFVFACWDCDPE